MFWEVTKMNRRIVALHPAVTSTVATVARHLPTGDDDWTVMNRRKRFVFLAGEKAAYTGLWRSMGRAVQGVFSGWGAVVSINTCVAMVCNVSAYAADLDKMFGSFDSAYTTVAAAKACELEPQIGSELFEFAQQHLAQLERKAGLSEARKANVRKASIKDVSTIVAIGACDSVLVAFRIFDLQRKHLQAQQSVVVSDPEAEHKATPLPEPISSEDVSLQANDVSADQTRLPIASGAYVREKSFCNDLRNGELEMIDFALDDNRRSFSTGENSCVVSSIKSLSASRLKVEADCNEFGELSQYAFFLDKLPNGDIRIDGDDLFFCSIAKDGQAPKQSVSLLIKQWVELNENCRGGFGDDPNTMKACGQRTGVSERLEALGYCYDGESTATSEWKTCE